MRLKRWVYRTLHPLRLLGVVSPSGRYKLPPRWLMSKTGRDRWHPRSPLLRNPDTAEQARTELAWAADIVAGPIQPGALTRFTTGGRAGHEHGRTSRGVCGPGGDAGASCFDRQPYGGQDGGQAC